MGGEEPVSCRSPHHNHFLPARRLFSRSQPVGIHVDPSHNRSENYLKLQAVEEQGPLLVSVSEISSDVKTAASS